MYEEFYGFHEKPFQIVPNPKYLYLSSQHQAALTYMEYGLQANSGFILLTGEIGSGKTTLINHLLNQIEATYEVAVIFNTNVTAYELFNLILRGFDLKPVENNKAWSLELLYQFLITLYGKGRRAILVIDEAQNLSKEALEEVRMLSNLQGEDQALLQIMLSGQPELKIRLKDPGLAQFSQRIAVNHHLQALTRSETAAYIKFRLQTAGGRTDIFTEDAVEIIYRVAIGIPRTINLICDSALVYGFADEKRHIDGNVIKMAIKELGIMRTVSPVDRRAGSASVQDVKGDPGALGPRFQAIENRVHKLELQAEWQVGQLKRLTQDFKDAMLKRFKEILAKEKMRSESLMAENTRLREKVKALQEARSKVHTLRNR